MTNSSVPSSSVTETADTLTQTGSPASSHTSLSVAGTKDGKDVGLSKDVDSMSTEEEISSNIPVSATVVPPTSFAVLSPQAITYTPTAMSVAPPPPAPP